MEYIECTHCGKRYAVSDKIRSAEGSFVRCKNCLEKFMVVVHDAEKRDISTKTDAFQATKGWDPTLTAPPQDTDDLHNSDVKFITEEEGVRNHEAKPQVEADERENNVVDWDPSLTMPESPAEQGDTEEEPLNEEEAQAKAEATLQEIKQAKKKKLIVYSILTVALVLLGLTLYMALSNDEAQEQAIQNTQVAKRLNPEDIDKKNAECRLAAARQWLLDNQAMHENYDAKAFMLMIKQVENREADVKAVCKNPRLLGLILDAATKGERPEWYADEIQAISQKR